MEKKQTAVDWLLQRFEDGDMYNVEDVQFIKEQANKMHKEEMIEFAKGFWYYGNGADAPPCYNEDVEKYYYKVYSKRGEEENSNTKKKGIVSERKADRTQEDGC